MRGMNGVSLWRRVKHWGVMFVPTIGARTLKTCAAIVLSVATARWLHLAAPQFAGIVSVLAVQPSVYRSLRQGLRQMMSALIGAVLGMAALYVFGRGVWVIGLVALCLMGLHVRWRWTNSLLVAVVIAINTMGSDGMTYIAGGLNQLELVAIGMGYGTVINLLVRPSHTRTAQYLRSVCEQDILQLWRVLRRDVDRGLLTPYTVYRARIDAVRAHIEEGRRFAEYVEEDLRHFRQPSVGAVQGYALLESLVERTRDLHRALQRVPSCRMDPDLYRLMRVVHRCLHAVGTGRTCHARLVWRLIHRVEARLIHLPAVGAEDSDRPPRSAFPFTQRAAEYQICQHLREFFAVLETYHGVRTGYADLARQDNIVRETNPAERTARAI